MKSAYHNPPLFAIERAAASESATLLSFWSIRKNTYIGVFGIRKYGSHLNGYVIDEDGTWRMWIGRRSRTKQTFPGMYDNLVSEIFFKDYSSISTNNLYRQLVVSVMIWHRPNAWSKNVEKKRRFLENWSMGNWKRLEQSGAYKNPPFIQWDSPEWSAIYRCVSYRITSCSFHSASHKRSNRTL